MTEQTLPARFADLIAPTVTTVNAREALINGALHGRQARLSYEGDAHQWCVNAASHFLTYGFYGDGDGSRTAIHAA